MTLIELNCKLKRCNKRFMQNRDWQKFCCKEHQREFWNALYIERYSLTARIDALEEKLKNKQ